VGVAGLVLKYRMPRPSESAAVPLPLQDARQAIRIARHRAGEWNLDPHRIGIMGFSAGGHLASTVGTHLDEGRPAAADPLARISARPDFMILIYPVISFREEVGHTGSRTHLLGKDPDPKLVTQYSNELRVGPRTPPAFGVHTRDDHVKIENSILFHQALKKAAIPSRLEIYEKGGHGYGLGTAGGEVAAWPASCVEWMKSLGLLDRPQ
jgi:acetyl esterase/lipase